MCLVVAAVFKTVEGQSVLGGFNSFPLRHFLSRKGLSAFTTEGALFAGCAKMDRELVTNPFRISLPSEA